MGRIDAFPPPRPPLRAPARKFAGAWKVVTGVLAVAVMAFGVYELVVLDVVRLPRIRRAAPASPSPAAIAPSDTSRSDRLARAITAIADPAKAGDGAETPGVRMARCLSFRISGDAHNAVSGPTTTTFRVSVTNICDSSFNGSDVWFEASASPVDGLGIPGMPDGRDAKMVQSFRNFPIEARGRAEAVFVMNCPACYAPVYRYEIALHNASMYR